MILGHIGARKGSKGVVGKNFRPIAGKRLIDWSLDQLFRNKNIDKVVVSTDDPQVYEHAIERGALDIGLRPKNLATDDVSKWKVWQHSLEVTEKKFDLVSTFLDLDCTCPLRDDIDIDNALELFQREAPDMVMSCCDARKNPYFNLVEFNDQGSLSVSKALAGNIVTRQQAPIVYEHAASTYVVSPSYLKSASFLFDGYVVPYVMPAERCLDIDTEFDFDIVEFLMEKKYK